MFGRKGPALDKEIDHAGRGDLGRGECVGARFDDDPFGADVVVGRFDPGWRLDDGSGDGLVFVECEAQGDAGGALHPVDADFTVALSSVGVAAGEQRAGVEDREVEGRSGREFADVQISAERARRPCAVRAGLGRGDAHNSAKRAKGDVGGLERIGRGLLELPVKEERLGEALIQETQAGDDGAPGPALMSYFEDIDLQGVAGGGVLDEDRAGKRVDAGAVDDEEVGERRGGGDLAAGRVHGFEVDGIPGDHVEAWRKGGIPEGMCGGGSEGVGGHGLSTASETVRPSTAALLLHARALPTDPVRSRERLHACGS